MSISLARWHALLALAEANLQVVHTPVKITYNEAKALNIKHEPSGWDPDRRPLKVAPDFLIEKLHAYAAARGVQNMNTSCASAARAAEPEGDR